MANRIEPFVPGDPEGPPEDINPSRNAGPHNNVRQQPTFGPHTYSRATGYVAQPEPERGE